MPAPHRHYVAALVALAATTASAQPVPLDSLARAHAETAVLPSLVIGVVADSQRVVVGVGDIHGAVPDAHTLYEIGSISKVLTSLALADAVTRGETTLDTPVAALLPDSATVGAHAGGPIRLADLATHTSGLPKLPGDLESMPGFDGANPYAAYGPDRMLAALAAFEPATAPGEAFAYSNWGAGLLGYALAYQADTTYDAVVRQRILDPLGLSETVTTVPDAWADRLAPAHSLFGLPTPHWDWTDALAGAGAWRSTPADLLTLVEALLAPETTPLAEALALATAPHAEAPDLGGQIGLGWILTSTPNGPFLWHNGMTGGSASFVGVLPEAGVGVVVLTNRQSSVDALGVDVLRRLLAVRS